MAFAWGDAAGGANKASMELEQALADRAYKQALIQQAEQQNQRLLQQQEFERRKFEAEQQRQAQTDSDARNQRGLINMAGDIADQYPNDPRKMVGTLIRAGVNVPASLLSPETTATPEQFTLGPGQMRFDAQGNVVARGNEPMSAAQTADPFTLSPGQVRYDAQGKVIARGEQRPVPAAGGRAAAQADPASAKFLVETADRTLKAIDDVLPDISGWTAGYVGQALSNIPGTPAANVSAELASVAGNVAFNALQQMRAASRTGGALGQVTERELDLLSSVEGSIRQNQSPANLRKQLEKIRESMQRIREAAAGGAGAQAAPTVENWVRDPKTGKLTKGRQ